jgi:predicted kinase
LLDYIANLDAGEDEIVIDNTNTSAVTISPYVALADAYGYTVNFVAMTSCHIDDCVERGLHAVPRAATENMARSLGKTITYWPAFWPKVQYA